MNLPLSLPAARYRRHHKAIDAALAKVFRRGQFVLGEQLAGFENEFAGFLGAGHCIGVGSGTDALEIALRACGIGDGSAVLTVAHTAVATVAAIERAGAQAVFVDIEASRFTMDPNRLEQTIRAYRKRRRHGAPLRAVVPVHLYGCPADMPAIVSLAREHELRVIEDCAQSHGAALQGRITGTWGDVAAFSFYPTKNLGAFGDGGAVVTNDSRLAGRVRLLREYGWKERHVSEIPGVNSRLDELQAAILRVLLKHLPAENRRRQRIANDYARLLDGGGLVLPCAPAGSTHVFHQYVVKSSRRAALQKFLGARTIATQIHYPVPIHHQPAYRGRFFIDRNGLPNTEAAARQVLSLPMSPYLSQPHIKAIASAVRAARA